MDLTAIIRKSADYLLRDYLDAPMDPSLEMLPVEGEREQVKIEDRNCFAYVLLSALGEEYVIKKRWGSGEFGGIPQLPVRADKNNIKPTFRSRVRGLVRPSEYQYDFQSIERALQQALTDSEIVEYREGVNGIFGITKEEIRHLLYIPAETAEEADQKLEQYRQKVNNILQPCRLQCSYKIEPLIKPGNIKAVPESLKDSYFGGGC